MNSHSHNKPLVGISRCLLGDQVRYDGDSKPLSDETLAALNRACELVAVCPEVEAGLGIPRPPVRLTTSSEAPDLDRPRVTGREDTALDVTDLLYAYSENKVKQLEKLSGFIFKSRSPSCGLHSTPVFINNEQISSDGTGVFAATLCKQYPCLVTVDEIGLADQDALEHFIHDVSQAKKNRKD
jgi:uncharacterized protein YbbK (DUF523 family)